MKTKFNLLFCLFILLSAVSCSKSGSNGNDYVSVQIEDSKMWSLLDVASGDFVMTDEFFAPSSCVVKGSFFVENDKQEFDLYNLKDTRNKLNRNSYTIVTNFNSEGYAIVRTKDEPWQIIDTQGNAVATLDKNVMVLSGFTKDGLALFMNKDQMMGYVNTAGEIVIKPRYKFGTIFSDGIAFVLTKQENDHNYLAAIDPAGNTVFSFSDAKYSDVGLFHDGYMFAVEGDHCVLLDKTGQKVMKVCNGTNISNLSYQDNKVIYFDGTYYGLMDLEEKILIRAKYQHLQFQEDGNLLAQNSNSKYGVITSEDDIRMPFDYDELYYIAPDRYITKAGAVFIMIDSKGKEICKKAFTSFSNRTNTSSEAGNTALITSSSNSATMEDQIRDYLLNLMNLESNMEDKFSSKESVKLDVSDVSAGFNGVLPVEGNNTYYAENMFDGNSATAWAVRLQNTDYEWQPYLYGPSFNVDGSKIHHIVIRNGYHKNEDVYNKNTRASWIRIYRDSYGDPSEEDILYEGPLSDTMSPQTLSVNPKYDNSRPAGRIVLVFSSADDDRYYHGSRWNDLVISELEFWGER